MAVARGQRVRFTVHCPLTNFGEHVRVVGSPALFGAWAPHRSAAVLGTSEADFPVWRSAWLELPEGLADFEYKYVICSDGCEPRWETRPNRKMQVPKSGVEWLVSAGFDDLQPPAWRDVPANAPQEGDHLPVVMVNAVQETPRFGGEARRQASVGAMMKTLGWLDRQQDVARRCTISSLGDIRGLVPTMRALGATPLNGGIVREVRKGALQRHVPLGDAVVALGGMSLTDTATAAFGTTDELPAAEPFVPAKATGMPEALEDDGLSTADTSDDCSDDHSASEHEADSVWEGSPNPNLGGPCSFSHNKT